MAVLAACVVSVAAAGTVSDSGRQRPRLVVGVIVDQMRWDYLDYYSHVFGDGGFRRLLSGGYCFDNAQIDYLPTVTACGHSCAYAGSVPAVTGIAGNNFYKDGRRVYCTEDSAEMTVGSGTDAGRMSPRNMRVTTMCDALKMAQRFMSKTVGVSLKDRGSILPAGHTADAAYWFDSKEGIFVSSTYYMKSLPEWVMRFNSANRKGHDIRYSPEGNAMVAAMAIAALDGERLGRNGTTDFLAVSFSSTDYIGHRFGTHAPQTEDAYRQLDRQIASLLSALDARLGPDGYLLFLSADHAAAHNAGEMERRGIPSGVWSEPDALAGMNAWLRGKYGTGKDLVKDLIEYRVYLDHEAIADAGKTVGEVSKALVGWLSSDSRVAYAVAYDDVQVRPVPGFIRDRIVRGYDPKRSGDIQIVLQPGFYGVDAGSYADGTSHGTWCPYDSHIPLIFYGWHVPCGHTQRLVSITDIAPTVCALLGVQSPDGCVGVALDMR